VKLTQSDVVVAQTGREILVLADRLGLFGRRLCKVDFDISPQFRRSPLAYESEEARVGTGSEADNLLFLVARAMEKVEDELVDGPRPHICPYVDQRGPARRSADEIARKGVCQVAELDGGQPGDGRIVVGCSVLPRFSRAMLLSMRLRWNSDRTASSPDGDRKDMAVPVHRRVPTYTNYPVSTNTSHRKYVPDQKLQL
jgi:hypothetical protein